ncbi:hypothetical protein CDAR_580251 [Caerostris darwini]|uniref:Uncharacterized protein n=1 Tax=Caerostris darwini TaxID=1538125 RepID=A0AAV4WHA2_9ARAC|nr:hypothetical protein CDAR_580251 [Caerostris darwini]
MRVIHFNLRSYMCFCNKRPLYAFFHSAEGLPAQQLVGQSFSSTPFFCALSYPIHSPGNERGEITRCASAIELTTACSYHPILISGRDKHSPHPHSSPF